MLEFSRLQWANEQRCFEFRNRQGILCHRDGVGTWTLVQWTNAMAGEVGEACNIAKKIDRGDFDGLPNEAKQLLAEELADVVCYADLAATRMGIDLGEAVRRKFNAVSDRINSDIKL